MNTANHRFVVHALCSALTGLGLLALTTPVVGAFVYETATEFTSSGDFDGDGREDIVVVDRASGNYRIAHQPVAGQHTWTQARASGVSPVTGFTLGRLLNSGRDALAFASPDANRINLLAADSATSAGQPLAVFATTVGPNLAVALDVGGAGNTVLDDLLVGSSENSGTPNHLNLLRNTAGAFTPLGSSQPVTAPFAGGNVVVLKSGGLRLAGGFLRGTTEDIFRAYNLSGGTLAVSVQLDGLATNTHFVHARFNASALAQFLFFEPGETNGVLRLRSVLEPVANNFTFSAESAFAFGEPIRQVFVLSQPVGARLLVVFGQGEAAAIYDFDGVNVPVSVQELTPPAGESFSGAVPLAQGGFSLFSGAPGSASSTSFKTFNLANGQYVAGQSGQLPRLSQLAGAANVFQFQSEPFVAASPNLVRTITVGDWSSALDTAALPQLGVTVESFVDSSHGLDQPTAKAAGPAHPLMHYGLVNQYVAALSFFSLARPIGDEIAEVKIAPPPGTYDAGVQVKLSTATPNAVILYRLGAGAWTTYSTPIPLFSDTTVAYYARPIGSLAKSVIRHATYHFSQSPGELDSDGDGVPDYVELAKGLNPKGGSDSDGDGYTDLEELIKGTNPNDKYSLPLNQPRLELKAALDLVETPRPLDGPLNALTVCDNQVGLRARDIPGALLRYSETAPLNIPGTLNPSVLLSNVVLDTRQRLLTLSTERHFDVVTPGTNRTRGRELLALRPVPDLPVGLKVNYTYGAGAPAVEANNWIAAAQTAANGLQRERLVSELGLNDTLAALLVEKKLSELLVSRGLTSASNLTLFPFRPADRARTALAQATLLSLEALGPNGQPAYRVRDIYDATTNGLSPNPALQSVAWEIYRLSSASNEVVALSSPVEALRSFLVTGHLPADYAASSLLSDADRTAAYAAVGSILSSVPPRPTTNLTLFVRPDTFSSDCVRLDAASGQATWNLFLATGEPFRLLETFALPPGSEIHVFGYTDLADQGCAGHPIEVIGLSLNSVPAVSSTDTDGDLLPDDLELFLFGNLSQNGNSDADGDGISNLQESLDGTDLKDALSKGLAAVNVEPPPIELVVVNGQMKACWKWQTPYVNKVQFNLLAADGLGQTFVPVALPPVPVGDGRFEAQVPNTGAPVQFYKLSMTLK